MTGTMLPAPPCRNWQSIQRDPLINTLEILSNCSTARQYTTS